MTEHLAMITFEEALAIVLASVRFLGEERVPLLDAAGRVLAADIVADADQPPFAKSAMDGFACRRTDLPGPLTVIETIAAGAMPGDRARTRARIMTGAPCPRRRQVSSRHPKRCPTGPCLGEWRQAASRQGEDVRRGDIVLARHADRAHIAVLATVGVPGAGGTSARVAIIHRNG
jgi:molybdopterin molybdotransferase